MLDYKVKKDDVLCVRSVGVCGLFKQTDQPIPHTLTALRTRPALPNTRK